MRASQVSSLIFRRRVPETPADAGSAIARARDPSPIRPGKVSSPSVAISSVTSAIGRPKRRSGLSEPYRSITSSYVRRGNGRGTSTPTSRISRTNSGSMSSKIVSMRGNDISTSTCVNSG
jgi:hypothetical protein